MVPERAMVLPKCAHESGTGERTCRAAAIVHVHAICQRPYLQRRRRTELRVLQSHPIDSMDHSKLTLCNKVENSFSAVNISKPSSSSFSSSELPDSVCSTATFLIGRVVLWNGNCISRINFQLIQSPI